MRKRFREGIIEFSAQTIEPDFDICTPCLHDDTSGETNFPFHFQTIIWKNPAFTSPYECRDERALQNEKPFSLSLF